MTDGERSRGAGVHLHLDDYPVTLGLLEAVFEADLLKDPFALVDAGYDLWSQGAWVDWDRLIAHARPASTRAAVHIARGCALIEDVGPVPVRLIQPLRNAISDLPVSGRDRAPGRND